MKFIGLAVFVISFATIAQENTSAYELENITVTAGKERTSLDSTIASIDVIDQEQIEMSGASSTLEAITSVPYIQHQPHNGEDYLQFQGLEGGYVVILIDGVPVSGDILSGQFPVDNIDLNQVQRIEITQGPNSTLYGSSAMAGVINIITKNSDAPAANSGKVSLEYGSTNTFNGQGNYTLRKKRFSVNASLGVKLDDGFTERMDRGVVQYDNYILPSLKNYSGSVMTSFARTDSANYSLLYSHNNRSEVGSNISNPSIRINSDDITNNVSFSYRENVKNIRLAGHFVYKGFSHSEDAKRITTSKQEYDTDYRFDDFEGEQRIYIPLGKFNLITGINALYETTENEDLLSPDHSRGSGALFSQLSFGTGDITLEGGGRIHHSDAYGVNSAVHAGMKWQISEPLNLRASYGKGFRIPSFKDLYYYWEHPAPRFLVVGNPDLTPELSHSGHLQFEFSPTRKLSIQTSGFYHKIMDKIGYTDPFSHESIGEAKAINIDESWRAGGELSANFTTGSVKTRLGYGYTTGKDIEDGSVQNSFLLIPHSFTYQFDYYAPFDLTATLNGKVNSPRSYPDESTYEEEILNTLNGAVRVGFFDSKLYAIIGGKNLFNSKTVEFNQQEGINFYGKIQYYF